MPSLTDRRRWLGQVAAGSAFGFAAPSLFANLLAAQDESPAGNDAAPQLGEPLRISWEMGVVISVRGGDARGLSATFPVPIDWPEQQVIEIDERFGDGARVSYRDMEDGGKLAQVRLGRLADGESVRATLVLSIDKRAIEAPRAVDSLVVPERLPPKLRGYLQPSPYVESDDATIRKIAAEEFAEPLPAWQRVETIYDWVREKIEYKFDERIRTCPEALEAGVGDCEELSSLFIAFCRVVGIPARAVWIPGHTYPEFLLADAQGALHWFPCQAAGTRDFGRMAEPKPILQKGDRFRIPGERMPQRYLKPTLTAQDASGTPGLEWVLAPL